MGYDGKISHRASQRVEEDRQRRKEQFQQQRERIFARQPRLRRIDEELNSTMSRIIAQALRKGADTQAAIARLKEENLGLQAEKLRLLTELNLPADVLDEKPACALCGDIGYRGGVMCRCLKQYCMQEQKKELSLLTCGEHSFADFDLGYYSAEKDPTYGASPRAIMTHTLDVCRKYGENFSDGSGNLFPFLLGFIPCAISFALGVRTIASQNGKINHTDTFFVFSIKTI